MYAHIPDPAVPLAETVEGFAELVSLGMVGLLGVSNHWAWMVERARAAASGLPGYEGAAVLPYLPAAAGGFAFVALAGRRAGGGRAGPAELSATELSATGGTVTGWRRFDACRTPCRTPCRTR